MPSQAFAAAHYKAAVDSFNRGLALYPQEQWMLVGLGSALDGLRRFDEARAVYQKALAWNPNSAQIMTYYATHLRLAGRFDEAEAMYKRSLKLHWNEGAVRGFTPRAIRLHSPPAQRRVSS